MFNARYLGCCQKWQKISWKNQEKSGSKAKHESKVKPESEVKPTKLVSAETGKYRVSRKRRAPSYTLNSDFLKPVVKIKLEAHEIYVSGDAGYQLVNRPEPSDEESNLVIIISSDESV